MSAKSKRPSGGTPAVRFLETEGIEHQLHAYDFDPGDLGIGQQAALALGVAPDRIFKTLMVTVDGDRLGIALVPADHETDLKALAAALGGKRAAMAPLKQAERASGYVKGGISPFGQRQALPVALDRSALSFETILVNGGRRGLQIELAPKDVITALAARLADLAR